MTYEHYLEAIENGVTDIEINIDEQQHVDGNHDQAISVTVTWAVTTDSVAWLTVHGNGIVNPAFGGSGTTDDALGQYAEHAVRIYRSITGDTETEFEYVKNGSSVRSIDA